jgi:beta-lactam-binding protein with PASTA domain
MRVSRFVRPIPAVAAEIGGLCLTGSSSAKVSVASAPITLRDVTNQNAEIVRSELEKLGLTNVKLSSVIQAANWTVVSIDPAAGTVVQSDDPVIAKVTKE